MCIFTVVEAEEINFKEGVNLSHTYTKSEAEFVSGIQHVFVYKFTFSVFVKSVVSYSRYRVFIVQVYRTTRISYWETLVSPTKLKLIHSMIT